MWWPVAVLGAQIWCGLRAWHAWQRLPLLAAPATSLPAGGSGPAADRAAAAGPPTTDHRSRHEGGAVAATHTWTGGLPSVDIIVPARDEAETLPVLLPSLLALAYPFARVLVVDDGSTDGTAAVARSLGVAVLSAPALPPGWAGKPHACAAGAAATGSAWLLFTDADTWHAPTSLTAAVAFAEQHQLDALSLFPAQRCLTFWERLLVPFAYRHYFAGVDARRVNDPAEPEALANGQYLLVRRTGYERAGGHAAVRDSIIEDVALAAVFKRAGVRCHAVRAGEQVQVRMYDGLGAIRRGFSKNSSRFLLANPRGGGWTVFSTLLDGAALPLLLLGLCRRCRVLTLAGLLSWGVGAAALVPWLRAAGVPRRFALLQPLAAAAFQTVALGGLRALRPGATEWKGRRY